MGSSEIAANRSHCHFADSLFFCTRWGLGGVGAGVVFRHAGIEGSATIWAALVACALAFTLALMPPPAAPASAGSAAARCCACRGDREDRRRGADAVEFAKLAADGGDDDAADGDDGDGDGNGDGGDTPAAATAVRLASDETARKRRPRTTPLSLRRKCQIATFLTCVFVIGGGFSFVMTFLFVFLSSLGARPQVAHAKQE